MTSARHLYLTRHGESTSDGELTERGRRQATLLGRRLRGVPLSRISHGPLPRVRETARLIGAELAGVPARTVDAAGDYVPYTPGRAELPPDCADLVLGFLDGAVAEPAPAEAALAEFTGPVDGERPRHELAVTHNFLIGWLVRAVQDAPPWRWIGVNHANAALTVIRYAPGRPASVLVYNDLAHLPAELRWTGLPPELHVG